MRRWGCLAAFALTLAAALFAVDYVFGLPQLVGYEHTSLIEIASRRSFDSSAWKTVGGWGNPVRIKMVDDLLRTHPLVGMPQQQVDALLGPRDKTSYFSDYDYVYWLGPERGFISIDSEWLCLRLKNHVVVEARVLRD